MAKSISTSPKVETAVLIAVSDKRQSDFKTNEYLDELEFLAGTLNIKSVKKFTQKLDRPDTRTFVGKGKLEEIKAFVDTNRVDQVIFDDDLSPSQVRNLEKALNLKIYDRSLLILDIFLFRAKTAQAKTQVELARSQYLLPRLTRMWSHLERQRGGTGTRGGAGEKELETDRRIIRDKINKLKKQLEKIDKQNAVQRSGRGNLVRVSLVGYTNVGKSTLMRLLSKSEVFAEDKLFATVDSTVRKVVIEQVPFLLSDTVGFIRKLPHDLIECFKSTLDEIRESDLLLHVVDIAHPSYEEHIKVVNDTLKDIDAINLPQILVFNKIDAYSAEDIPLSLDQKVEYLEQSTARTFAADVVFVSAVKKFNIDKLRSKLHEKTSTIHFQRFPNYLN